MAGVEHVIHPKVGEANMLVAYYTACWKALFHYNNDVINSLNSKANVMKSNEKLMHFKLL